jgi:hypothetical protein
MQEQIIFTQSPEFRRFVENLSNQKAAAYVHGVFIHLHPVWQEMFDYARVTGTPTDADETGWWPLSQEPRPSGTYDVNPEAMPMRKTWDRYCERCHKKPQYPFVVTLWVLPLLRENTESYRDLIRLGDQQPFFVRLQERPMAELAVDVEGATEITAPGSGALGGFLRDQDERFWGVTCGHVARVVGDPFHFVDIGGTPYPNAGKIGHSNFASLIPAPGGLCNPYVNTGNPDTDGALLEPGSHFTPLNTVKGLGTIDEIFDRKRLNSGSSVCMNGIKSGVQDYAIGGYGVTLKVKLRTTKQQHFCFSHVFEFYDPRPAPSWMPAKVVQWWAARPLQGDSGSWVCFRKESGTFAYFGNLIAVQGLTGIATFADSLIAWANTCGIKLSVF